MKRIATFSIVAFDAKKQEWGVAVQSKFFGVGAVVPFAKAGVGAVATQSYANMAYGADGLSLMADGNSAQATINLLTAADEDKALRQVGMVDKNGNAGTFTGEGCYDWAGGIIGDGFTCQGNILIPGTVEAMANQFELSRKGKGELADWLVDALISGQGAGGDSRGRQSASVLVVRENGGYGGNNDRYLDVRVDDHPTPIIELKRLVSIHHLFFGLPIQGNSIPLKDIAEDIQKLLIKTGHYQESIHGIFDDTTRKALRDLVGNENLEERWKGTEDNIDLAAWNYLKGKFL